MKNDEELIHASGVKKFRLNLWSLTISQLLYRIVSLILAVYIARVLGAEDVGLYYTVISIVTIFGAFTDLGITNLIIKEVSQNKSLIQNYLNNFFSLQLMIGVFFAAVIILFGYAGGYSQETINALMIGSSLPLLSGIANCFNALLSAQELLYPFAFIEIISLVVFTLANVLVMILQYGVFTLIAVMILTALIKLILALWWGKKFHLVVHPEMNIRIVRHLLILGFPFLLFNGIHFALQRIDVVYLSFFMDQSDVGKYAAASRLIMSAIMFASITATALFPALARLIHDNRPRAEEVIAMVTKILFLVGFAIAISCTLSSRWIIHFLYGVPFSDSIEPFIILSWFIPIFANGIIYGNVLIVGGKVWSAVWISVISILALTAACFFLIPKIGKDGTAYGLLIAETIRTLGFIAAVRIVFHLSIPLGAYIKTILTSCVGLFLGYLIKDFSIPLSMVASLTILFCGAVVFKVVTRDNLKAVTHLFFIKENYNITEEIS